MRFFILANIEGLFMGSSKGEVLLDFTCKTCDAGCYIPGGLHRIMSAHYGSYVQEGKYRTGRVPKGMLREDAEGGGIILFRGSRVW